MTQLKDHLLPRVQETLRIEALTVTHSRVATAHTDAAPRVIINHDTMFFHKLVSFNYTTYDVRRAKDLIHMGTDRVNIMLLNRPEDPSYGGHHFLYARVLGAYHVNAIYTGPGAVDHEPRRMEFLWVRWYDVVDEAPWTWLALHLPKVRFPPITDEDAFGFIDPGDVLRACHIIPVFHKGRQHADDVGVSVCANDSKDWVEYYVGW